MRDCTDFIQTTSNFKPWYNSIRPVALQKRPWNCVNTVHSLSAPISTTMKATTTAQKVRQYCRLPLVWVRILPPLRLLSLTFNLSYKILDCRVCHTWFKGTSQSSTNLESVGTSDSQASKSTQYDARQTQRSVNSFVDLSNQNNARRTRDYQAKPQYGSDINDTNSNTWRICNPKGEKIIPLLHRSRKNKEMHIVSPSSISADAVISPVSPSPHTRLLSLFYW